MFSLKKKEVKEKSKLAVLYIPTLVWKRILAIWREKVKRQIQIFEIK